jgi:hypothetical protein
MGDFWRSQEYGARRLQSFIIILEGRERSGWVSCGVQMWKVAHYLEEEVIGSKYIKKHEYFSLMLRLEEKERRSFVEVLVGKQQPHEMALVSRGRVGILGTQKESVKKDNVSMCKGIITFL